MFSWTVKISCWCWVVVYQWFEVRFMVRQNRHSVWIPQRVWGFYVLLLSVWVSSRWSGFLPQSKDVHSGYRRNGHFKQTLGANASVNGCFSSVCLPCNELTTWWTPSSPQWLDLSWVSSQYKSRNICKSFYFVENWFKSWTNGYIILNKCKTGQQNFIGQLKGECWAAVASAVHAYISGGTNQCWARNGAAIQPIRPEIRLCQAIKLKLNMDI